MEINITKDILVEKPLLGGSEYEVPSVDEVMKLIEKMVVSDKDHDNLKKELVIQKEEYIVKAQPQTPGTAQEGPSSVDYVLCLIMLGVIALIFALFGYKLYKSLMEKKQKKQEKQKTNKKSKKAKQK